MMARGHFGVERTLTRLQNKFYWYKMKTSISGVVNTPAVQLTLAQERHLKPPTVCVGAPFEKVAIDLIWPLNETERYNRYILVVQDYFSKWVHADPIPNEQATTVVEGCFGPSKELPPRPSC